LFPREVQEYASSHGTRVALIPGNGRAGLTSGLALHFDPGDNVTYEIEIEEVKSRRRRLHPAVVAALLLVVFVWLLRVMM
jgi:hypothetical protein